MAAPPPASAVGLLGPASLELGSANPLALPMRRRHAGEQLLLGARVPAVPRDEARLLAALGDVSDDVREELRLVSQMLKVTNYLPRPLWARSRRLASRRQQRRRRTRACLRSVPPQRDASPPPATAARSYHSAMAPARSACVRRRISFSRARV